MREVAERARKSGALQPIATREHFLNDAGLTFVVRVVDSLRRKARERRMPGAESPANPFLPYETELFVGDAGAEHVCLLNKFPVVDHHVLIVTRQFEEQTAELTGSDFGALWPWLLTQDRSLGFYNGGREAGASQPHKHLQVVPLPLASQGAPIPLEPLLPGPGAREGSEGEIVSAPLPFPHRFVRFAGRRPAGGAAETLQAARTAEAHALYGRMLAELGVFPDSRGRVPPYNLLMTREWMLLVPRSRESFASISINALGFAGALLAKDEAAADRLRHAGPAEVLRQVSA